MKSIRLATMAAGVASLVAAIWYITLPQQEPADVASSPLPGIMTIPAEEIAGVCVLASDDGLHAVRGTVHFRPKGGEVEVTGRIEGLTPGHYRFLVAEFGDLRSVNRGSIGEAFFRMDWPLPSEGGSIADRMSFEVGESGVAILDHLNPAFTMYGPESIIGRPLCSITCRPPHPEIRSPRVSSAAGIPTGRCVGPADRCPRGQSRRMEPACWTTTELG
ncbi:MAG: superoxide dismutase family protein [Planctomycetota bacterium]|nr:superoxide dismutase family protein [Planctomycetaceae bacterium]MDQ3329799.1 superoxide dismutase family protein [Planctomycetota bacterium]